MRECVCALNAGSLARERGRRERESDERRVKVRESKSCVVCAAKKEKKKGGESEEKEEEEKEESEAAADASRRHCLASADAAAVPVAGA